ncbi:MAG: hypothetical protein ACKOA1_06145 [Bacteroidota bacterium]
MTDRSYLSRLSERLLLRHAFVASCVLALWFATRLSSGHPLAFEPELVVLFFGSSAYYDLHVHSYNLSADGMPGLLKKYWPGFSFSGILILFFLTRCSSVFIVLSIVCFLFALTYSVPLLMGSGGKKRVREWPVMKIIVVGLAYAVMTVLVPGLDKVISLNQDALFVLFIQRMIIVACLCIPFEIRDRKKEHVRGVRSLMDYGVARVRVLAVLSLMIGCSAVVWGHLNALITRPVMISEAVLSSVTFFWMMMARENWPGWIYTYLVDGTMLLLPILIILFIECP